MDKFLNVFGVAVWSIIFLFIILFVLSKTCKNFLLVDEEEMIEDSKIAFSKSEFSEWPFQNKDKLERFSKFLLLHLDSLAEQSRMVYMRKTQRADGSIDTIFYKDRANCQRIKLDMEDIRNSNISKGLKDSIFFHLAKIDRIEYAELCLAEYSNPPNVTLKLAIKDTMEHCYVSHLIYFNKKVKNLFDIETMYKSLHKDSVLNENLRYGIRVSPYTGI